MNNTFNPKTCRFSSEYRMDNGNEEIRQKLVSIVTQYDQKQEKKSKSYNPYALAQMLESANAIASLIQKGTPVDQAIDEYFLDRLADFVKSKMRK